MILFLLFLIAVFYPNFITNLSKFIKERQNLKKRDQNIKQEEHPWQI